MEKLLAIAVLSIVLFSGCTTFSSNFETPTISYTNNEFNGTQMWLLRNNRLWNDELGFSSSQFAFDLEMFVKGGKTEYLIMIDYYSDEKIFVNSGESLILFVDGERMGLSSGGAFDNWQIVDGVVVRETAYYDITKKQLELIANAKKVKAEIMGRIAYTDLWLHENNIANVKNFYDSYVDVTQTVEKR